MRPFACSDGVLRTPPHECGDAGHRATPGEGGMGGSGATRGPSSACWAVRDGRSGEADGDAGVTDGPLCQGRDPLRARVPCRVRTPSPPQAGRLSHRSLGPRPAQALPRRDGLRQRPRQPVPHTHTRPLGGRRRRQARPSEPRGPSPLLPVRAGPSCAPGGAHCTPSGRDGPRGHRFIELGGGTWPTLCLSRVTVGKAEWTAPGGGPEIQATRGSLQNPPGQGRGPGSTARGTRVLPDACRAGLALTGQPLPTMLRGSPTWVLAAASPAAPAAPRPPLPPTPHLALRPPGNGTEVTHGRATVTAPGRSTEPPGHNLRKTQ